MPDSGPRKILVAIDFGTTFSGVAWADTRRKQRTTIKDWPDGSGNDDKVPTMLQYKSSGFSSSPAWGYEVERDSNAPTYEMFKLGLDPKREKETKLARDYPSVVRLPTDSAEVENLVADYLKALRVHFESQLEMLPNSMDLQSIPRQYIITVPAMWSERAQDRTRACAEKAGMGRKENVGIISEPEAAAIRVLEEMREDEYRFKIGDTFVVCDAGGGTVDLISYTVTGFDSLTSSKPILQVKEAAKGEGYVCGGIFVNRVFAKYMRDTYENNPSFSDEVLQDAVREFEQNIKKRFDGNTNKTYKIRVGMQTGRDITDGNLRLSGVQVKKFFDPVIREVEGLVVAQLTATNQRVKCVVLVGGFGGNKYLKKRLESAVGDRVKISRPKNTLTAVVEGALLRGLVDAQPGSAHIRVEARIARRYYGTSCCVDYVSGVHDRSRRESGGYEGVYNVRTLQWFAEQNEHVRAAKPFPYYWDKPASDGIPDEIKMYIYSFEARPGQRPPLYPDHPGVTELGMLRVKIRDLPGPAMRKELNSNNVEFYIVDFDIQMTLHSASLTFALLVQGIKYHELSLDFN